jgi:tetratricopeptide (TPR) repeat protein
MKQLCQEIEKIIEAKGLKKIDIAKQIGVTPTAITKVLKGEATFELILDILKAVEPDHYLELLTKDDNLLKINTKNWRDTLEFASTNRLLDLQEKLVEKALNSNNKRDNEFGMVYGVLLTWQDESKEFDRTLYEDVKRKINCEYMKALCKLFDANLFHFEGNFLMVGCLLEELNEILNRLDDSYLKKSIQARTLELLCHVQLRVKNDVSNALESAEKLIKCDIGKTFTAYGHYIRGLCLIESDFKSAKESFMKGLELYKKSNRMIAVKELSEIIEFLTIYYKADEIIDCEHEISNALNLYYKKDLKEAEKYLELVKSQNPLTTHLKHFLKGIIKDDHDTVMKSLLKFVKSGDKFFANLPYKWLVKKKSHYLPIIDEILS